MKKGNLKQFFKEIWGWFAFGIWLFLISGTIGYLFEGQSIGTKITLIAVSVIYTVAGFAMMAKAGAKWEKQEAETKQKRLLELEERYKYYIDLVNSQVQETLNKFEKKLLSAFEIISEPSTYYQDNFFWLEEKHPKVNIVVPNGLIKNSDLYQRIISTIYHDDLGDKRTSIMQFSNLLHLIYLNC